jgi:hypothetical protein
MHPGRELAGRRCRVYLVGVEEIATHEIVRDGKDFPIWREEIKQQRMYKPSSVRYSERDQAL